MHSYLRTFTFTSSVETSKIQILILRDEPLFFSVAKSLMNLPIDLGAMNPCMDLTSHLTQTLQVGIYFTDQFFGNSNYSMTVLGQNGRGQNGTDKMVRTKWHR